MSSWRVGGPIRSGTWLFVKFDDGKTPFDVMSMCGTEQDDRTCKAVEPQVTKTEGRDKQMYP